MSAEAPSAVGPLPPFTTGTAPMPPSFVDGAPEHVVAAARRRRGARRRWAVTALGVDVATLAAAVVASAVGARASGFSWTLSPWTLVFAALTLALFQRRKLYELRLGFRIFDDLLRVAALISLAAAIILTARLLVDPAGADDQIIRPWVFALVYVSAGRIALYVSHTKARASGHELRPSLLLGAGRVGRVVARRLLAQPQLGLVPVGFLDDAPLLENEDDRLELPLVGSTDVFEEVIERFAVEHLIVTFSNERDDALLALVNRAEALGVTVSIVPRLYEKVPERITVEHLGGLPLITPHASNPRGVEIAVKYAFDRLAAAVLVVLTAPLLLGATAAIYLLSGRPILFRQLRIGRDGKAFEILKFRTMKRPTAAELEMQAHAIATGLPGGVEGVDRRTTVGKILRKTSLDELPQLFNVLRGDMSIVGPRPERPEFVSRFAASVYRYTDRHRVKSGITGWSQVHGLRGKTSIDDRAEWDNWYVENFSLWLDVKILCMTAGAVLGAFRDVE